MNPEETAAHLDRIGETSAAHLLREMARELAAVRAERDTLAEFTRSLAQQSRFGSIAKQALAIQATDALDNLRVTRRCPTHPTGKHQPDPDSSPLRCAPCHARLPEEERATRHVEHWTDLLGQDEIWQDANGVQHGLDDMDPGYCARVRRFALRQADAVLTRFLWEMTRGPGPSGDVACDAFNMEYDMLEAAGENPEEWMAQQPLLVALARRAAGKPARDEHASYAYEG